MKRIILIYAALLLTVYAVAQDGKAPASGFDNNKGKKHSVNYDKNYGKSSENNLSSNNGNGIASKDMIWHLMYMNSFKEGDKGAYGFGADGIGDNGFGVSTRMVTNAFLVDSEAFSIETAFGINYHAAFGDMAMFTFPVLLGFFGYNDYSYDSKTNKTDKKFKLGLDLQFLPALLVGRNGGISIGPYYVYNFPNKKGGWGGHVSIWF